VCNLESRGQRRRCATAQRNSPDRAGRPVILSIYPVDVRVSTAMRAIAPSPVTSVVGEPPSIGTRISLLVVQSAQ
jgi:hypothetical protein